MLRILACLLLAVACRAFSFASATPVSAYSPHTPGSSPWFEGWYIRIQAENGSAAFGIGHYPNQATDKPRAACFLIHRDTQRHGRTVEDHFYMPHNLEVTARPDTCSGPSTCTPSFQLLAAHGTHGTCQLAFDDDTVHVHYHTGRYSFNMSFPNRAQDVVHWSPHQHSPMGWLAHPPFSALVKLQWYVYSLRTPAVYSLADHGAATSRSGVEGYVHLEKNWGTGFPASWLWSQGQGSANVTAAGAAPASSASTPAAYVLAGGRVPHAVDWLFMPQLFAFAFHSPLLNVTTDADHPPLWERVSNVSGCRGTAELTLRTWRHVVRLSVSAAPRDFTAVTCPNSDGFMDLAVEAFSATTRIQIFTSNGVLAAPGELLAEASFQGAALEFGGTYRCQESAVHSAHRHHQQNTTVQHEVPLPGQSMEL